MSQTGLKTGDLDLDRRNFTFKLELCIDHLKVLDYSKTCDLDLDLQVQNGLQTWKIFALNF